MRRRCRDKNDLSYHNYGGRGIKVCARWDDFNNFLADVGPRPSRKYSLDRYPNNDGNYEPSNVRWATMSQQGFNKRKAFWERVALILAGDQAAIVSAMAKARKSDKEVALHIARVFKPVQP